jgi:hypothetical protein
VAGGGLGIGGGLAGVALAGLHLRWTLPSGRIGDA